MAATATPAAGGVVWRRGSDGSVQVALVHRPRYDDWSLPKGKIRPGESILATAVREVREELGASVAVSRRLPEARYRVPAGRKTVAFWAMRFLDAHATTDTEVDEVVWLPPKVARKRLTYGLERQVLADFDAEPPPESVVVLVRHAKAGKRSEWRGNDYQRPLDFTGEQHALRLVPFLRAFAPDQIYSADPVRCIETVQPLADELSLHVQVRPVFSDLAFRACPEATRAALLELVRPEATAVVCSQGDAIPGIIEAMVPGVASGETRKGAVWVLSMAGATVVAADYYEDPTAPAAT